MKALQTSALLLFTCAAPLSAQQSVGATYGSREPRTCASMKSPVKGVLSAEQARQYLQCNREGVTSNMLYLWENVKVEVGKGTPYRELSLSSRPSNGDPEGSVYQIRGSYKQYQCSHLINSAVTGTNNTGKNCNVYDQPKATGTCYRDNFGEWQCNMSDLSGPRAITDQPAPK